MKNTGLLIALIPINLVMIFFATKQLSGSQETAWRMVEITGGIGIVIGFVIFLVQKLNKPKNPN